MKVSKYNFFYRLPNNSEKLISYNSRTNALALIEKENYDKYNDFAESSIPINDEKLIEDLKKGGFLIDENVDELDLIKFNMLNNRYSTKSLSLTIAPTMDCNFACIYCYEKGKRKNVYMSEEVQDKIIDFIEQQAEYVDNVYIGWYGGEPLLAFDIIKNMSERIMKICKRRKIEYNSFIITNGYNLSKDIAMDFEKMNIEFVQVTIDGPEDIHNIRRPLKSGQGSFNKILENLGQIIDIFPNISLRINVDKKNVGRVDEVLNKLEEFNLKDKVSVYLGYIEPTNDCYSQSTCLDFSEYSYIEYQFNEKLEQKEFINDKVHKYPVLKGNFCGADSISSLVIDPNGNIYKCWSDVGTNEYKVGNIIKNPSQVSQNVDKYMQYMLYDATMDVECKECKVLPLCMGGCPRRKLDGQVDRCNIYKYVLEEYIESIADTLQKRL